MIVRLLATGIVAALFQGCAATGAVGVAATALSIAAGVAAPKNPGQIEIDPNKSLKDKLRGVEKGATAVCRAAMKKPIQEAAYEPVANIPKGCQQRQVCLRGALKPIVMLVCERGNASAQPATGPTTGAPRTSEWEWQQRDAAVQSPDTASNQ